MSNEIKIEDTERDEDMDGEIHHNPDCNTVPRDGTYECYRDGREQTLKVLFIFMVCHCGRKKSNPLPEFDHGQSITKAECIDIHLPDKGCSYERYPQYDDDDTSFRLRYPQYYDDTKFRFKCFCNCRDESVSYPGR